MLDLDDLPLEELTSFDYMKLSNLDAYDLELINYFTSDKLLVVRLAGCSLAKTKAKDSWLEDIHESLPQYICEIGRALIRGGKSVSEAISIAISRCKVWAAGGDKVNAKTRTKAAAAISQWEAIKAKAAVMKSKKAAKGDVVKATHQDGSEYVFLCATTVFDVDAVRDAFYAWDKAQADVEDDTDESDVGTNVNPTSYLLGSSIPLYSTAADDTDDSDDDEDGPYCCDSNYHYLRSMWTDHLIMQCGGSMSDNSKTLKRMDYTVCGLDNSVSFSDPVEVQIQYVPIQSPVSPTDDSGTSIPPTGYPTSSPTYMTSLSRVIGLSHSLDQSSELVRLSNSLKDGKMKTGSPNSCKNMKDTDLQSRIMELSKKIKNKTITPAERKEFTDLDNEAKWRSKGQ